MAPLIGISSWRAVTTSDGMEAPHLLTHATYARAVEKAGGLTVVLPELDPDDVDALLDRIDGVVIVGGPDVDPARYGEAAAPQTEAAPAGRDAFDLALARRCVERNHPLLAVCRGVQVLNVAMGGALVQHVDGHMERDRYNETVHHVSLDGGCRIARILESTEVGTNSLHHQAVGRPGDGVRVVARAAHDDTVEAIEVDGASRVLGVQWHAELLRHRPEHLALFAALVSDAGSR